MTSIVAATGIASPPPWRHPKYDSVRARGCTGGHDNWGSQDSSATSNVHGRMRRALT